MGVTSALRLSGDYRARPFRVELRPFVKYLNCASIVLNRFSGSLSLHSKPRKPPHRPAAPRSPPAAPRLYCVAPPLRSRASTSSPSTLSDDSSNGSRRCRLRQNSPSRRDPRSRSHVHHCSRCAFVHSCIAASTRNA
eukprot:1503431-Pleurochrysis_carterae.AAC.9